MGQGSSGGVKKWFGGSDSQDHYGELPDEIQIQLNALQHRFKLDDYQLRRGYAEWCKVFMGNSKKHHHQTHGEIDARSSETRFIKAMEKLAVRDAYLRASLWRLISEPNGAASFPLYIQCVDTILHGAKDAKLSLVFQVLTGGQQTATLESLTAFVSAIKNHVPVLVTHSGTSFENASAFAKHLWRVINFQDKDSLTCEEWIDGCYNSADIVALI